MWLKLKYYPINAADLYIHVTNESLIRADEIWASSFQDSDHIPLSKINYQFKFKFLVLRKG